MLKFLTNKLKKNFELVGLLFLILANSFINKLFYIKKK